MSEDSMIKAADPFILERHLKFGRCRFERQIRDRYRMGVALGVFQEAKLDPDSEVVVARLADDRRLAGFATFYGIDGQRLWLHLLWVDSEHRRRGLGLRLIDEVHRVAHSRGLKAVLLGRSENNTPMQAVLERAGSAWEIDQVVYSLKVKP